MTDKKSLENTNTTKYQLNISVRNLVEFVMRSGDIDNRATGRSSVDAMAEGTRIHKMIQKEGGANYKAEVSLKMNLQFENYDIQLEGRADGIITEKDKVTIDEIKGIYKDVMKMKQPIEVHKAQAMCYAYMYMTQNHLSQISVRMTYCNLDDETIRYFETDHTAQEVKNYFEHIVREYKKWSDYITTERTLRQESIKKLQFPFEYRNGQREIAVSVYKTVAANKHLFIQAPTGVGKTMSAVFPAVKSMGENLSEKIFYLTAKTITRTVASNAYDILRQHGLHFHTVTLTAKEKICSNYIYDRGDEITQQPDADKQNSDSQSADKQNTYEENLDRQIADKQNIDEQILDSQISDQPKCVECNPDSCPMAKGHFDRVNDAIFDIITHEQGIDRDLILKYAQKYNVCPFEMSLDVSNFMDGIICDYNYVFDPHARLKRYFADGIVGNYVFLIDEAHNLVERAREMYSAELIKEDFLMCRRIMKDRDKRLFNSFGKCNQAMLALKHESVFGEKGYDTFFETDDLIAKLTRIRTELEKYLDKHKEFTDRDIILDMYFKIKDYLDVYELVDSSHYQIYSEMTEEGSFKVKLFCVNPSGNLSSCMAQGNATILFSATLLPVNYYKELLTGNIEDNAIYINSPFEQRKRLLLMARDVSSKYTRRNRTEYGKFLEYIEMAVSGAKGNYMVFFPSYKMMTDVYELAREYELTKKYKFILQKSGMDEKEREEFLNHFEIEDNQDRKEETVIGFCVLGGIFSEGIDLKNDRLIGSIIVGTGLPMVCNERQILKEFYDKHNRDGFDYAYKYPGMNKVMQAAGRVIRTTEDYGVILLLDERFMQNSYRSTFPREWSDVKIVTIDDTMQEIKRFWKYV